ncbi:CLUMA_CG014694, isoform A [Clunio marinus]|uniref:CLUMA_CG014694, isoform A n=1 Tax=Clunio marinus TaxID=568069 RepID=A0A1J1IR53_9DIPT|nr:CLUMA_CG014694, isoform A [Clunio marinus]
MKIFISIAYSICFVMRSSVLLKKSKRGVVEIVKDTTMLNHEILNDFNIVKCTISTLFLFFKYKVEDRHGMSSSCLHSSSDELFCFTFIAFGKSMSKLTGIWKVTLKDQDFDGQCLLARVFWKQNI